MRPFKTKVTLTLDMGVIGQEREVDFVCVYTPGTRESGVFHGEYDPGSDSDVIIISAVLSGTDFDMSKMFVDPADIANQLCDELDETDWAAERSAEAAEYDEERGAA